MRSALLAAIAGLVFGLGLGVSGMTDPSKVIGFLDVTGDWDPSLAFVMMGAIAVHFAGYRWVRRRARPLVAPAFEVPASRAPIDGRLLGGAALFGVGWGLAGYCPGPAVVSVATGALPALVFVGSMLAGMIGLRALPSRRAAPVEPACG